MLEELVLAKIGNYTKPVKTKHLAKRLGIDRPALVAILNRLQALDKIKWHKPKPRDEKKFCGWVINAS